MRATRLLAVLSLALVLGLSFASGTARAQNAPCDVLGGTPIAPIVICPTTTTTAPPSSQPTPSTSGFATTTPTSTSSFSAPIVPPAASSIPSTSTPSTTTPPTAAIAPAPSTSFGEAGGKPQKWWQRPLMFIGIPLILAWLAVTEAHAARAHALQTQTLGVSP